MQQHIVPLENFQVLSVLAHLAASDSIRSVTVSVPVHPEDKHSVVDDFKQKNKRKPSSEQPSEKSEGQHPDSDHQIDEYV